MSDENRSPRFWKAYATVCARDALLDQLIKGAHFDQAVKAVVVSGPGQRDEIHKTREEMTGMEELGHAVHRAGEEHAWALLFAPNEELERILNGDEPSIVVQKETSHAELH